MLRILPRYTLDDGRRFRDVCGLIHTGTIWYLATPYSNYPHGHDSAYADAASILGALCKLGIIAYSPIVHWHDTAKHMSLPTDAAFWRETNDLFMRRCYGALVAELPDWSKSTGVCGEIEWFRSRGHPVRHLPVRPVSGEQA